MVKMPRTVKRYSPAAGKRRVTAGYRGFPRPKPSGEKPTRRVNLIYRCTETGKAHSPSGKRARKFELIDK